VIGSLSVGVGGKRQRPTAFSRGTKGKGEHWGRAGRDWGRLYARAAEKKNKGWGPLESERRGDKKGGSYQATLD